MPKPDLDRKLLRAAGVVRAGDIYVIDRADVASVVGRDIEDRWVVVVQSNKLAHRNTVLVLTLTGAENVRKDYPWTVKLPRSSVQFLDKDSVIHAGTFYNLPRGFFYEQYCMGSLGKTHCKAILAAIQKALFFEEFA